MALDQQNILEFLGTDDDIHEPSAPEVGYIERLILQWKPWRTYLWENVFACSLCITIPVILALFTYLCIVLYIYGHYPEHPEMGYLAISGACLLTASFGMFYYAIFRRHPPFLASKYGEPIYGISVGFFKALRNPVTDSPAEDGDNRENMELQERQRPVEEEDQPDVSSGGIQPDGSSSDDVPLVKSSSDAKSLKRPQSLEHPLAGGESQVKVEVHRSAPEIASPPPSCSSKSQFEFEPKSSDNDPLPSSKSDAPERGKRQSSAKTDFPKTPTTKTTKL